jgi:hypothetical protein
MPSWLRALARRQPVRVTVYPFRALAEGGPGVHDAWQVGAWIIGFIVVFGSPAVAAYRQA